MGDIIINQLSEEFKRSPPKIMQEESMREFIIKWSRIYRSFKELQDQIRIRGYMQSEDSAISFYTFTLKTKMTG